LSRVFNGTSDLASVTVNLSGQGSATISAWMMQTAAVGSSKIVWEYGQGATQRGFDLVCVGATTLLRSYDTVNSWGDTYPTPSLNVWHHYLWMVQSGSFNRVFIDGNDTALTNGGHGGGATTWTNNQLTIGARTGGSLFFPGIVAEFAIWNGFASSTLGSVGPGDPAGHIAKALANGGAVVDARALPDVYIPFLGDPSPEPDYSGPGCGPAVLTGTTVVKHPGCRSILMPSLS